MKAGSISLAPTIIHKPMRHAGLSRVPSITRRPSTARMSRLASREVRWSQWRRVSAVMAREGIEN
jgi:hypothetical protein